MGMVDFVLTRLGGVIIEGHVVLRVKNPSIRYLLQKNRISRSDIYTDLTTLYRRFMGFSDSYMVLGAKMFMKECPSCNADEFFKFTCRLMPDTKGEQLQVLVCATIGNLKRKAEIALRDTYYEM